MEKPLDETLSHFLDALASSAPSPGGGSAAALCGAIGAALVSMVCNLTQGKKGYEEVQGPVAGLLERAEALRERLQHLLEEDIQVYPRVVAAYRLPKQTEEEKAARKAAIQEALKAATEVPLAIAEACAEVMTLCGPVAEWGNRNAVSDAGVAVLAAEAGLRSAALNVLINLNAIEDEEFVREKRAALDALLCGKAELREAIYARVKALL